MKSIPVERGTSYGPWMRQVTVRKTGPGGTNIISRTQVLDLDEVLSRMHEAMRERPDAGRRIWLDVALNGWGDDNG